MNSPAFQEQEIFKRIHNDLVDSFDEELEMEIEDGMLPEWQVPETEAEKDAAKEERRQYFRKLFWMQGGMPLCITTEEQRRRRAVFSATLRAAVLWAPAGVARSASISPDTGASLAPWPTPKPQAAHATPFPGQHTSGAGAYSMIRR